MKGTKCELKEGRKFFFLFFFFFKVSIKLLREDREKRGERRVEWRGRKEAEKIEKEL